MRDIKFRGWDYTEETMIGPFKLLDIQHLDDSEPGKEYIYDSSAVMQYTGLKDSKSVEIYEGDVIKMVDYENKFNVSWDKVKNGWNFGTGFSEDGTGWEIIGNIYESPKLLNTK